MPPLGSRGVVCLNTFPVTVSCGAVPMTTLMVKRDQTFSTMPAPRDAPFNVVSFPAWSTVASTGVSVLPAS